MAPIKSKILEHPDKDLIITKLVNGESLRSVVEWNNKRWKDNKKYTITIPTLQKFRKQHLKIQGQVLKDIQEQRAVIDRAIEEQKLEAKVKKTSAYQQKINEVADTHLDVAKKILQLDAVIDSRMQHWYDAIKSGEATAAEADKELRAYIDRQLTVMAQYKKFVEGIADHTIDHNININVFNDQIAVFRDIISEILTEMEPDKAIVFMEKVNNKLGLIEYKAPKKEVLDIKVINELCEAVTDDDG